MFRPQAPVSGDLMLSISGPLELARGERPSVPDIDMLGMDRPERWLLLPGRAQGQTCPLANARADADCPAAHAGVLRRCEGDVLQSFGQTGPGRLGAGRHAAGSGVVRLADVTLIWCGDGTCCGGAVFDLEPGGAGECPLNLPKGYELIQVSVDGLAVAPARWRRKAGVFRWLRDSCPSASTCFFAGGCRRRIRPIARTSRPPC